MNRRTKRYSLIDRRRSPKSFVSPGRFCVEATIPTPSDWEEISNSLGFGDNQRLDGSFVDRMIEILRKTPVLRLEGNRTVTL